MEKAVALLCVFGLGMCFSLLGSISVKLMPRLGIDQGKFGSLISVFMTACLVASLLMGVVTDQLGFKPVAIFGCVVASASVLLLARGKTYRAVQASCLLLGFGAMALNTAGNTLIPIVLFEGKNKAAASNLGNVFFGVGLLLAPLIVSFLFRKTTYEKAVSTLAVILLAPVAIAILATYPEIKADFRYSDALAMLAEPVVLVSAIALLCYASLDTTFSNWLPAFGKEIIGQDRPGTDAVCTWVLLRGLDERWSLPSWPDRNHCRATVDSPGFAVWRRLRRAVRDPGHGPGASPFRCLGVLVLEAQAR